MTIQIQTDLPEWAARRVASFDADGRPVYLKVIFDVRDENGNLTEEKIYVYKTRG